MLRIEPRRVFEYNSILSVVQPQIIGVRGASII